MLRSLVGSIFFTSSTFSSLIGSSAASRANAVRSDPEYPSVSSARRLRSASPSGLPCFCSNRRNSSSRVSRSGSVT
uniref:Putative secreted protein n=1 Tax=Anopheles marajoara TaxID=58244 RepID=A0A2M4CD01_9DIPT